MPRAYHPLAAKANVLWMRRHKPGFQRSVVAALACAFLWVGCGGSGPDPETPEAAALASALAPAAPKPRDAARRAEAAVQGKIGVLVWVDRVRGHPVGARVLAMPMVADLLEGTGLDPLKDLERVFVSAPGTDKARAVMFAEHNLDTDKARAALERVLRKSDPPGQVRKDLGVDAVQVTIKGRTGVVALLPPHFLVVVPEDLASHISDFEGTGGLADPTGPEAAVVIAIEPHESIRGPHVPRIPETISRLTGTVVLRPDGGVSTAVVGDSSSPEQAVEDARKLGADIERATTVKVAFVTLRVIDPIPVVAEGSQIKAKLDLSKGQIEQMLDMAQRFLPQ